MKIRNRTALVTGAAGGIGADVVAGLVRHGAVVAAVDRDAGALREFGDSFDEQQVTTFVADVASSAAVEDTVAAVEQALGPVDFLVSAAGVLRPGSASTVTDEDWRETFAINADGVFHVLRAVGRRMVGRGRGSIVTIASNAASTPRAGMAAYAASKAAAAMYTKCLGLEFARHGVRCNVVAPGSTDTEMLRQLWEDGTGKLDTLRGEPETFRLGIPLGKLATPADVTEAVIFLLSEHASHITMHDLVVDGGATLGV